MQNLKIRVNNDNASEVIDLLVSLGHKTIISKERLLREVSGGNNQIVNTGNGLFTTVNFYDVKEITLPELRDMVVLKRNDMNDATHESSIYKYFKACDDWYYFDLGCTDKWQKSSGAKPEYYGKLKPIEKNMKEYLMPFDGGYSYILTDAREGLEPHAKDWIEIPEGMNFAYKDDMYTHFTKLEMGYRDAELIWQRDQDEPFLTPETTLNDQYAEIEEVRQSIIKVNHNPNQQPREIQKNSIEGTLSERQSQYGCYEDVAQITQQILAALRIGNYDKLPAPMKESLHMIASKMARIVNGDPEYFDNWHDIGGYAKLIEKLIKGE